MKRRWLLVLLGALLVLGAACGGGDDEGEDSDAASRAGAEAESPDTEETEGEGGGALTITGVDYAFKVPASVPAGATEITFENAGEEPHQLIMALLKEGAPDISKLVQLPQKEAQKYLDTEINDAQKPIGPGESTTFTTDLKPGTYGMVCFVESKEKKQPHAFLGMVNQFTVE